VLGSPVSHSLSPLLHRTAWARLGLPGWRYDATEVADAARLAEVLDTCDRTDRRAGDRTDRRAGDQVWVGLSLTMPLKTVVQPLLDSVSALAEATGSVNTVLLAGGRHGDNTDVPGILAALAEAGPGPVGRFVVLGGGATAASALAAGQALGAQEQTLVVRDPGRAGPTLAAAERLGLRPAVVRWTDERRVAATLSGADVVVSTAPGSAGGDVAGLLAGATAGAGDGRLGTLLDVAYHPWPTGPARAWRAAGGTVVGGFSMLLHQAMEQVRLMTGRQLSGADVEAVRRAGGQSLRSG
jgi:shikimate dehydrogenase